MAHYVCRYCDRPEGYMGIPIKLKDELICACGAEWSDAKILVEDDVDPNENLEILSCGCFEEFGCGCVENEDDFMSDEISDWGSYDELEEDDEEEVQRLDCGCREETGCLCEHN